ncbi:MAG TPA: SRPBCC family protein [Acidimicrobiia bacterium]|nr:SRPBCC family protein [Acidimicrobiia bacterium]
MRRRHIEVTAHSDAAPDAVFALLADGTTWPRWSPIESFELEREGDPAPEGPGAIRVFRRGRTVGRDQLVDVAPSERLVYASLSGLPVRDYLAEIELTAAVGGTDVRWQASFFPKIPGTGWLWERGLRRFLEQCARGVAAHARS